MSHLKYHNKFVELSEVFYESHCELITSVCIELGHPDRIKELQEKLLDKMKLKPKKDPEQPRKPKTSYMYFCKSQRDNILKDNPNILLGDQSKKLGNLWANLDGESRKPYIQQADDDKSRYDEEIEEYRDKYNF